MSKYDEGPNGVHFPEDIYQLVRKKVLKPSEMFLLALINRLARGKNGCYASNEWLGEEVGLKHTQIKTILKKLRDMGLIRTIKTDGRKRWMETCYTRTETFDSDGRKSGYLLEKSENSDSRKTGWQTSGKPADNIQSINNRETPISPLEEKQPVVSDDLVPEVPDKPKRQPKPKAKKQKSTPPSPEVKPKRIRKLWLMKSKTKRKKLAADPDNMAAALDYMFENPDRTTPSGMPYLGLKWLWKRIRPQESAWARAKKNAAKLIKAGENPEDLRRAAVCYAHTRLHRTPDGTEKRDNPKFAKSIANFFGKDEVYLDYIGLGDNIQWQKRVVEQRERDSEKWETIT